MQNGTGGAQGLPKERQGRTSTRFGAPRELHLGPKRGVLKMILKMDPQKKQKMVPGGLSAGIFGVPGGMGGGTGEERRGKPLRVWQGFYARILKQEILKLGNLRRGGI